MTSPRIRMDMDKAYRILMVLNDTESSRPWNIAKKDSLYQIFERGGKGSIPFQKRLSWSLEDTRLCNTKVQQPRALLTLSMEKEMHWKLACSTNWILYWGHTCISILKNCIPSHQDPICAHAFLRLWRCVARQHGLVKICLDPLEIAGIILKSCITKLSKCISSDATCKAMLQKSRSEFAARGLRCLP